MVGQASTRNSVVSLAVVMNDSPPHYNAAMGTAEARCSDAVAHIRASAVILDRTRIGPTRLRTRAALCSVRRADRRGEGRRRRAVVGDAELDAIQQHGGEVRERRPARKGPLVATILFIAVFARAELRPAR